MLTLLADAIVHASAIEELSASRTRPLQLIRSQKCPCEDEPRHRSPMSGRKKRIIRFVAGPTTMSSSFSASELGRLLTVAFTVNDELDAILTIALKACQAEGVPVRLVVSQVFESWAPASNYPLKKVCRALARLDQLEALAPLLNHNAQAVRLAVIHAYYNFGVTADVRTLETLLADQDPEIRIKVRDAIDTIVDPKHTPRTRQAIVGVLSDDDLQMTRIMLGRPLESADIAPVVHLLFSPSGPIRQLARKALQSTSHRDTLIDSLEGAITSEASISAEAVETLRDHDSDRAIALLIRVLADSDRRRGDGPRAALESLGPKAAPKLLEAFAIDGHVRRRWGGLVARVADPPPSRRCSRRSRARTTRYVTVQPTVF